MSQPAGYSNTPLVRKLGIKPGHRLLIVNAPADFAATLGPLPTGVTIVSGTGRDLDVVLLFLTEAKELAARFPKLTARLVPDGMIWVAWPKGTSGVATDLNFAVVQSTGLATGLVDTKVCAIDAVWSGLKFVYRLVDRPKK